MNSLAFPVIVAMQYRVEFRQGVGKFRFEQIETKASYSDRGGPAVHYFGAAIPEQDAIFHVADGDGIVGKIKKRGLIGDSGCLLLECLSTVGNARFQIGIQFADSDFSAAALHILLIHVPSDQPNEAGEDYDAGGYIHRQTQRGPEHSRFLSM